MFTTKVVALIALTITSVVAQCGPTTSSSGLLSQCDSCPTIELWTNGQGVAVTTGGADWTFSTSGLGGSSVASCNSVSFSYLNGNTWVNNGTNVYSSGGSTTCSAKSRFQNSQQGTSLLGLCIRIDLSGTGGYSIARRVAAVNSNTVAPTSTTPSTTSPSTTPTGGNSPCPTDGNSAYITATGLSSAFCWYHPQGQVLNKIDAVYACAQRGQHMCTVDEFLSIPNTVLNAHINSGNPSAAGILSWWVDSTKYPMEILGTSGICAATEDIAIPAWATSFIHYGPGSTNSIYQGTQRNALTYWCNNIPISWACCGPTGSYPTSNPA